MLVTGRLAPSPTGALHLGHAFSFLLAWWSARSQGGSVLLRLEDVDAARSSSDFNQGVVDDLSWLGIDWDGPPIIQSNRIETLRETAERLLSQGDAYPCICTRAEIRQAAQLKQPSPRGSAMNDDSDETEDRGAPQQGSVEHPYPGTCRGRFASLEEAENLGSDAGLRFATRSGLVEFYDQVHGPCCIDVEAQVGDFQILRRDKTPAYQLAVVVDDHLDQVTEVVRGNDLLESSARQIQIAQALGFPSPRYCHVPLVCDHNGRRLAKRYDTLSLRALRDAGVAPEEIVTWVARAARQIDPDHSTSSNQTNRWGAPNLIHASDLISRFNAQLIPRHDIIVAERLMTT